MKYSIVFLFFLAVMFATVRADNSAEMIFFKGKPYKLCMVINAKVTAYDPLNCDSPDVGKTSIGQNAWIMDGVAADPRAIPYGMVVKIPNAGFKEIDDTGSAMRKSWKKHKIYHIDLRMPTNWSAKQWGVRWENVKVYVPVKAD